MQLAREPVSLLDHRQLARPLAGRGVLDRDRRMRREQADGVLVILRELPAAVLVDQIERAPTISPPATIGTPRNEVITGCADGHHR